MQEHSATLVNGKWPLRSGHWPDVLRSRRGTAFACFADPRRQGSVSLPSDRSTNDSDNRIGGASSCPGADSHQLPRMQFAVRASAHRPFQARQHVHLRITFRRSVRVVPWAGFHRSMAGVADRQAIKRAVVLAAEGGGVSSQSPADCRPETTSWES
jgi:hypothetical protein